MPGLDCFMVSLWTGICLSPGLNCVTFSVVRYQSCYLVYSFTHKKNKHFLLSFCDFMVKFLCPLRRPSVISFRFLSFSDRKKWGPLFLFFLLTKGGVTEVTPESEQPTPNADLETEKEKTLGSSVSALPDLCQDGDSAPPSSVPTGPAGPVTCRLQLPCLSWHGAGTLLGFCTPGPWGTLRCLPTPHWTLQAGLCCVGPTACRCGASSGPHDAACGPSSTIPNLRGTGPKSKGPFSCSTPAYAASWTLLRASSTGLVMARMGLRHSGPQQASASTCSTSSRCWSCFGRLPRRCGHTAYSSSSSADDGIGSSDTIVLPHTPTHPPQPQPPTPTPHPNPPTPNPNPNPTHPSTPALGWIFFPATSSIAHTISGTCLPSVQARPGLWTSDFCSSCIFFLSIWRPWHPLS